MLLSFQRTVQGFPCWWSYIRLVFIRCQSFFCNLLNINQNFSHVDEEFFAIPPKLQNFIPSLGFLFVSPCPRTIDRDCITKIDVFFEGQFLTNRINCPNIIARIRTRDSNFLRANHVWCPFLIKGLYNGCCNLSNLFYTQVRKNLSIDSWFGNTTLSPCIYILPNEEYTVRTICAE